MATTLWDADVRPTTIALLFALAGAMYAAWFFTNYEKVVVEQPAAFQGEARFNPFLAAEMLLIELGIESESRSSLTPSQWLPEHNDTLFVRVTPAFAVDEELGLLSAWIADGGHLVLLPPERETSMADDFLDYLGFRLVEIEKDDDQHEENQEDDETDSFAYLIDLDWTRFRIEMTNGQLEDASLSDEYGIVAVRRQWVAGHVTVIASAMYFENRFIADSDHARLLLDTVAGYIESGKVWFIYDAAFPPLWKVIWNNAAYVVVGLATMLAFWLWSIMPTFGPKIRPGPPARRSIIEHIRAAGHFVWRHHGAKVLAACSAAAVMHDAESRHPGISRLSVEKQAALIARMTGQSAQAVMDVLLHQEEPRRREFAHNMQLLQTIRKEL